MASEKRSISFDEAVLREAEALVADAGGNLSAFVNAAVLHEIKLSRGRELLADDEKTLGPVPEAVRDAVASEWPA